MRDRKKCFFRLFIILVILSPWLWVLIKNNQAFRISQIKKYQFINAPRLYQINTYQGETSKIGLGLLGRLEINKYSWIGKDILARTLESFDFHFLFFQGDLDINKSMKTSGPILLSFLPLIIFGFYKLDVKKRKYLLVALFILASIGAFSEAHYEIVSRLPFILLLTLLAAYGSLELLSSALKNQWKIIYFALVFLEFTRFLHDFINHYGGRLLLGN